MRAVRVLRNALAVVQGAEAGTTSALCSNCSNQAQRVSLLGRVLARHAGLATATASASAGAAGKATEQAAGWTPFSLVLFLPSAVCGCLAYWQYERMQWKDSLIRSRQSVATAEPADLFQLAASTQGGTAQLPDYTKVSVTGRLLEDYSLFIGPRPRSIPGQGIQQGYLMVTPMLAADRKGAVLINRGWVPKSWKTKADQAAAERQAAAAAREAAEKEAAAAAAAATAAAAPSRSWWGGSRRQQAAEGQGQGATHAGAKEQPAPQPPVTVVGVLQPDEQPNQFIPQNQPDADEFHYVQREALAQALGLPASTPLLMALSTDPGAATPMAQRSPLEEARAPSPDAPTFPIPKHVDDLTRFTTMPADHRNYALVWVTLCVALGLMARQAVVKPLRGPRIVDDTAREAWKASQAS